MKKRKLWAIIVLSSFFTQQLFAYSGDIAENNVNIEDTEIVLEEINLDNNISNEEEIIEEEGIFGEENQENYEEVFVESEDETQSGSIGENIYSGNSEVIFGEEEEVILESTEEVIEEESILEEILPEESQIFDFGIHFQNPSYILEKDIQKDSYICDPDKNECKINFNLVDALGENFTSKYTCGIEYSIGIEKENSCNPTTIILSENTEVIFSVFHNDTPENIVTKKLYFTKNISDDIETSTGIVDETNDGNISENETEETTGSGGIDSEEINSGTGEVTENDTTGTGVVLNLPEENNNSGSTIGEDMNIILPEIILSIQSGLEYSGTGNIYICEKEECKVNLDISESFTGGFVESDFECRWNFGSGTYSTQGTDTKCNPGYVNYGTGIHEILMNIYSKNDNNFFTGSQVIIQNEILETRNISEEIIEEEIISNTGSLGDEGDISIDENLGNGNANSGSIDETGEEEITFTFPNIAIEIQSGAEYMNSNTIKCNKENCKINLDTTKIFSDTFLEKNYECRWNFGNGSFSSNTTLSKCNPGYVDYNIGDDKIIFYLSEKNNPENFITQSLYIQNNKIISKGSSSGGGVNSNEKAPIQTKDYGKITEEKNIIIQSGLENNICNSEECKINLNYENSSYEKCSWDFGSIEVVDKYKNTCNPGFIYAQSGVHKIVLNIYNGKVNNNYQKTLIFQNHYIHNIENKIDEFEIILQGKTLDYKKYYENKIVCFGVEKCNINLNLETNSKENLEYKWDFGNGEISTAKNPKSIWFATGSYIIHLDIIGDDIREKKLVQVEVIPPIVPIEQIQIAKEFEGEIEKKSSFFTQIGDISFNGFRSNVDINMNISEKIQNITQENKKFIGWFEKSEMNNKLKLTRNISQQKKSLKISGTTFPNSSVFILKGENILELESDNFGKYEKKLTNIDAGIYNLEYAVLDKKGNLFESKKTKELVLTKEYVTEVQNKNMKLLTKKNITKKKISGTKEIIQENIKNNIQQASIIPSLSKVKQKSEYIFQLVLLLLSLLGGSILLKRYKIL